MNISGQSAVVTGGGIRRLMRDGASIAAMYASPCTKHDGATLTLSLPIHRRLNT